MIEELSTPQLLQRLSEQTRTLVQQEVKLAQLELTVKAKRVGAGVAAFAGAAVLGYFAVMVLLALVLAVVGKAVLGRAGPPAPTEALASAKADVAALKTAAGR